MPTNEAAGGTPPEMEMADSKAEIAYKKTINCTSTLEVRHIEVLCIRLDVNGRRESMNYS
jgi:hypothetical protein